MGRRPSISMSNSSRWSTLPGDRAKSGALPPSPFSKIKARHVYSLAIAAFLVLFSSPLHSHNFYVTNTKDDGSEGTFRWAVGMCDWYPEICDTVMFAIPLNDPGYDPSPSGARHEDPNPVLRSLKLRAECRRSGGSSARDPETRHLRAGTRTLRRRLLRGERELRPRLLKAPDRRVPRQRQGASTRP